MIKIRLSLAIATLLLPTTINAQTVQQEKSSQSDRRDTQQPANTLERNVSSRSIKGRVIGEGGRAVANALITAIPVNIASDSKAMMTSFLSPASSDADGYFQLSGLQSGAYTISASVLGYVLSDAVSQPFYRLGDTVTLNLVKGGVITGKVTNASGDPVVGAVVRAIKIRGIDNKRPRTRSISMSELPDSMGFLQAMLGPFKTDDRGIYRIYGLEAGYYQVAAGGRGASFNLGGKSGAYDGDAPTYFPSSTIDTASEVIVRAGDEAINIDIRYRDNRGHSLSGTISGSNGSGLEAIQVFLTRAGSGIPESSTFVLPLAKEKGFAFDTVLDGEYFVTAVAGSAGMGLVDGSESANASVSASRRVTVSGSDVTGVELVIEPLASIAGRALIETISPAQKAECKPTRAVRIEEVIVTTKGDSTRKPGDQGSPMLFGSNVTTPNEKGEFTSVFLRPGIQHLDVQLPGENHYLKGITMPSPTPNGKPVDAAKSGVKLKAGDKVKGVVVTISEGAAGLMGKVITGKDKTPLVKVRVHLVPAEPESSDDVLRYYESEIAADGGFAFTSLAPGKYWIVAREVADQEDPDRKPLSWDVGSRMTLRFEGEGTKKNIELAPCQRLTDLVVTYIPLAQPSKPVRPQPR